jgi:hypothetical protein
MITISPPNSLRHRRSFALIIASALVLLCQSFWVSAAPVIRQPNGSVVESAEDMRVQVVGGVVAIQRTWSVPDVTRGGGKWYINPYWAELRFTLDSVDGSVRSVSRLDAEYGKSGNGIYLFDRQDFISAITQPDPAFPNDATRTITVGWRYYNTRGDWVTYNALGYITAYGDRNNTLATFDLDANSRPQTIKDAQGGTLYTFTYTGAQLTRITDRSGRQVSYSWTDGLNRPGFCGGSLI